MNEIRKDIVWLEWEYMVSNMWNVKSLDRKVYKEYRKRNWEVYMWHHIIKGKILSQTNTHGYLSVRINNNRMLVHRLVYCTFNDIDIKFKWQKSNTIICHINDNKKDNRLENLFLWTQCDNIRDCISKWRRKCWIIRKEKIWFDDVIPIKEKYNELKSIYKVADIYWVSYATISRVINNKIWNMDIRVLKDI